MPPTRDHFQRVPPPSVPLPIRTRRRRVSRPPIHRYSQYGIIPTVYTSRSCPYMRSTPTFKFFGSLPLPDSKLYKFLKSERCLHPAPLDLQSAGSPAPLCMLHHAPLDLAITLGFYINKPLNHARRVAKFAYHPLELETSDLFSRSQFQTDHYLAKYFKIFNSLFFMGMIEEVYELRFQPEENMPNLRGSITDITEFSNNLVKIDITKIETFARAGPTTEQRRRILTTLLHEMAHAYLRIYACHDTSHPACKKNIADHVNHNEGHGTAFKEVISHIQKSAKKELGGIWNFRMYRYT